MPNHSRNHLKVAQSSFEGQVWQGNSLPASAISCLTFPSVSGGGSSAVFSFFKNLDIKLPFFFAEGFGVDLSAFSVLIDYVEVEIIFVAVIPKLDVGLLVAFEVFLRENLADAANAAFFCGFDVGCELSELGWLLRPLHVGFHGPLVGLEFFGDFADAFVVTSLFILPTVLNHNLQLKIRMVNVFYLRLLIQADAGLGAVMLSVLASLLFVVGLLHR